MDPNATLRLLRRLVAQYNDTHDFEDPQRDLVDAIVDLDEWLTKGGFLPAAWDRVKPVTTATIYTLAEIRNGTGFPRGARFAFMEDES